VLLYRGWPWGPAKAKKMAGIPVVSCCSTTGYLPAAPPALTAVKRMRYFTTA
jgi:hypothetical protein